VPYRYAALGVVCLGVFIVMTDSTSTTIALPTLAETFDKSQNTILWVVLANSLIGVTLALTLGRFGDLYGRKRFFGAGFALFTIGAIAISSSGSFTELIGARVLQSLGTNMIMANVAAIVFVSFPPASRAAAFGIMSAVVGIGWASGPLIGGLLIEEINWRAIYWVRIPLGLAGIVLVWRVLRDTPRDLRPTGFDIPGALTLSGALFTAVLAVNRGGTWGWDSQSIIALFSLSALLIVSFVWIERRAASPVVALDLFRRRPFSGSAIAAVLLFFGINGTFVLIPFVLVTSKGLDTFETGAVLATLPLAMATMSPIAGWLSDRIAPRHLMTVGLLTTATGMLLLATMSIETSVLGIVLRLALAGAGRGLFDPPNMAVVMSSVPADRLGTASATTTGTRAIGSALGVAVGGAIFSAQSIAFANARSSQGLDDPAILPEALLSGLELAMFVAAGVAIFGAIVGWISIGKHAQPAAQT
jgi:EmrB/QacA subfamily drug resistance transporter